MDPVGFRAFATAANSVFKVVIPISAIDSEISYYQRILSSLPRSDPSTFSLVATLARL